MFALVCSCLGCMIAAFMLCGIPFGMLIAQKLAHIDVRSVGSGNIGMTNVARSVGARAAILTLVLDMSKGLVAMLLARFIIALLVFGGTWEQTLATGPFGLATSLIYASCVLGHVFSPYLGFHGGKGISVGFGAALGFYWPCAAGIMAVFLLLALPSAYVSLGSIFAALSLPIWGLVFGLTPLADLPLALVAAVVIWAHRSNIKNLIQGKECRFSLAHSKSRSSSLHDDTHKEERL